MPKSRWPQIAETLRLRIERGELRPGDRLETEVEIAAANGVSRQTAHRAVGELQRMGLVRRHRRWGTVIADPVTEPRSEVRRTGVALIVDGFAPAYDFPQAALLSGLHEGLTDAHPLTMWDCRGAAEREAELLRRAEEEAAGIVLFPTSHPTTTPVLQALIGRGFPLVLIDRVPKDVLAPAVSSDNEEVTQRAVRMLVGRGHRRIGFLGFDKPHVSAVVERHRAYVRALTESGLEADPALARWFPYELEDGRSNLLEQQVQDALFALVHGPAAATALFCVQDVFAACAIRAAERLGIAVPERLEIVTFNDWPAMMLHRPWLVHRISQRTHDIGLHAAELLRAQIDGHPVEPRHLRIPADLHVADGLTSGPASP
jgi:DNA-binding LacI/PurR family transcriptional regulator/DNA-binding transcriptional regulator YhcF (GntR family)